MNIFNQKSKESEINSKDQKKQRILQNIRKFVHNYQMDIKLKAEELISENLEKLSISYLYKSRKRRIV